MDITANDLDDLKYARSLLESPGLAIKITQMLGAPIEKGFSLLPAGWADVVSATTGKALQAALRSAILTMNQQKEGGKSANGLHKLMAAGSGAVGGFCGLPALAIELPFSTTIMMRSIADIARSEGHSLAQPLVKIACLQIFSLGGPGADDDAADIGYFTIRSGLAKSVSDAAQHLAQKGSVEMSSPALIRLIAQVSSRFGVQVSEKVAAQAIPVIGAAGGAAINSLFIDHFQNMARGHFIVLRLEEKYGALFVQQIYESL